MNFPLVFKCLFVVDDLWPEVPLGHVAVDLRRRDGVQAVSYASGRPLGIR